MEKVEETLQCKYRLTELVYMKLCFCTVQMERVKMERLKTAVFTDYCD